MQGVALTREQLREVFDALASGLNPMQAARATGVSKSVIYVLHHKVGGCIDLHARPTATGIKARMSGMR
jgi:hypothetical protein